MSDLTHYDPGDVAEIRSEFRVDDVLVDPTTVTADVAKPNGIETTYTFGVSPELTKSAVGVYHLQIVVDLPGTWYVIMEGTGTASGSQRHSFVVNARLPSDLLLPSALTTIENVELFLDRVGTQGSAADEEDDKRWIAELINTFSAAIQNHTGRQFKPTQTAAAKIFSYDGEGSLSLTPYEATSITSVVAFTDRSVGEQETWTAGYTGGEDYYAFPRQKTPEGTYLWLDLPRLRGWAQVTVTGNWGAGVVPADVEYVCKSEVANAYVRATARVTTLEGEVLNDVGPFALSNRSIALLSPYSNRHLMIA